MKEAGKSCKHCTNNITTCGEAGMCKVGGPYEDELGSCKFYKKQPEHDYSRKCENCLKYGKDMHGTSWCTNIGAKTRKNSSCTKFIRKK